VAGPRAEGPPVELYRVEYASAVRGQTLTALFRVYVGAQRFSKANKGKLTRIEVSQEEYRHLLYKNKLEYGA
jgi:hypothetical protein